MAHETFRIVGVGADGSRRLIMVGLSYDEAVKMAKSIGLGDFGDDLIVEPDPDGPASGELFPPNVQPTHRRRPVA